MFLGVPKWSPYERPTLSGPVPRYARKPVLLEDTIESSFALALLSRLHTTNHFNTLAPGNTASMHATSKKAVQRRRGLRRLVFRSSGENGIHVRHPERRNIANTIVALNKRRPKVQIQEVTYIKPRPLIKVHHDDETAFPFLELPRELRDDIYRYSTVEDQPLSIRPLAAHSMKKAVSLLHSGPSLRQDLLPLFCGQNTFEVPMFRWFHRGRFFRFLDMLGPNTHLLRKIQFVIDDGESLTILLPREGSEVQLRSVGARVQQDGLLAQVEVLAMEMAEASEYGRLSGKAWVRLFDFVAEQLKIKWV